MLLIVLAVALLARGAWWYFDSEQSAPGMNARGYAYVCNGKSCGHVFFLSQAEMRAHQEKHYGQAVPCPKCGKTETVAGIECPHCRKISPSRRGERTCPGCSKDLFASPK